MRAPFGRAKSIRTRLLVIAIAIFTVQCPSALAQTPSERFWIAGRYGWNRVLIYFDAVQFEGKFPAKIEKIPCPVQIGLFCPVKLPASIITQFQKRPNSEHFALGDKYDLLVDGNSIATVTLTTLVGFESDEGVGNDSFIGALGTVEEAKQDWLYFTKSYLAVRRHREVKQSEEGSGIRTDFASLVEEPISFDIQSKIASLLQERMNTMLSGGKRREAQGVSPSFTVQQFRLSDGGLRYYARAAWKSGVGEAIKPFLALGAWIAPSPTLHVQAVEDTLQFEYLPELLNVIDLRNGNTAIVIRQAGNDSGAISLLEYHDGVDLEHMRILQSIGAGE
jgi:hypothetical protein